MCRAARQDQIVLENRNPCALGVHDPLEEGAVVEGVGHVLQPLLGGGSFREVVGDLPLCYQALHVDRCALSLLRPLDMLKAHHSEHLLSCRIGAQRGT
jgi:hypothetical protein